MYPGTGTNSVDALIARLRLFKIAETGVSFKPLIEFSRPLFELYELDADAFAARAPDALSADELTRGLSALEAGRLIWAYLSMDEAEAARNWPLLVKHVAGPSPSKEEQQQLAILLEEMRARWDQLGAQRRIDAREGHDFETLSFRDLLARFQSEPLRTGAQEPGGSLRFGPERLALPDAMALFARPILEKRELLTDAEKFENAMSRAGEYWELAQAPVSEFAHRLERIKASYARSPLDASRIEQEAGRMVARFFELFPEQKKTHST